MGTKIQVIVPVMVPELYYELLSSIGKNKLKPTRILVINNSCKPLRADPGMPVEVIHEDGNIGVNRAWNLGIAAMTACDLVSILNDDILLPATFFSRLVEFFTERDADKSVDKRGKRHPCGVVCPHTVDSPELMHRSGLRKDKWYRMSRREGWAFTIKKPVLDRISPIPDCFTTFFGDDWFWHKCHKMNRFWFKDFGNVIFHHGGASCHRLGEEALRKNRFLEYQKFTKMKEEGTF